MVILNSFVFFLLLNFAFTQQTNDSSVRDEILKNVDAKNIADFLRFLSDRPHMAGRIEEVRTALYVKEQWEKQGLDQVELVNYTVLLSYPDFENPNKVLKLAPNGTATFRSKLFEDPLKARRSEQQYYYKYPPFLGYAPATKKGQPVVGELVYVNYGRAQDFDKLVEMGVNLTGKIILARYGHIFRANKVMLAHRYGAVGALLYDDPKDYTAGDLDNVYPDSIFVPKSGVQRGTLLIKDGDPRTPGYPSIKSAYRLPNNKLDLPKIPAHCINYEDAKNLLSGMKGPKAPEAWTGGLNVAYNIGPGHTDGSRVSLEVNNRLQDVTIRNVVGIIKGRVEPDRYVLVGNHRDAWTFGSADPSSGTASMLEVSNAITKTMRALNWRPRRSVVFISWAAEEYGLIGSNEWVEQNVNMLRSQAVAYLNVDIAVSGNDTLDVRTTPLLFKTAWDAAKSVPNPNTKEIAAGRPTTYDTWLYQNPWNVTVEMTMPSIRQAGSGSDHNRLLQLAGVSAMDLRYDCGKDKKYSCYPLYHTLYETFDMLNNLSDIGFIYNKAVTQFWAEMARSLADSNVLPLSIEYYPGILKDAYNQMKNGQYFDKLKKNNVSLSNLQTSINNFNSAVKQFLAEKEKIDTKNVLQVRRTNDILMQLERAFIDSNGLPHRSDYKHVISAPSSLNSYSGLYFPGLNDLLWQTEHGFDNKKQWEMIKKHLSVIIYHIDAATQLVNQRFY